MNLAELAPRIESTLLRADTTRAEIEKLCGDARANKLHGVVVSSSRVALAAHLLEETDLKVCAAVGFPLGTGDSDVKRYEAEVAIDNGAQEIEVVLNHGWLKDGDAKGVLRELRDVVEAADERPVKVLIETSLITPEFTVAAAQLAAEAEAKFVTLSGVFGTREVSPDTIDGVRKAVGTSLGLKLFTTVSTLAAAQMLIGGGIQRLGISALPSR